jgi:ribosomal protein L40E
MAIVTTCPGCKGTLRIREEYAGKAMVCPRCSASLTVPDDSAPVLAVVDQKRPEPVDEIPARRHPGPRRTVTCPECGARNPEWAKKCRACGAGLDRAAARSPADKDDRLQDRIVPCPRCGGKGASPVTWTWWGSYLGPKLCHLVSCPGCEHTYNGKTGGSNLFTKIALVLVPFLGIAGILVGLFFILRIKGVF